jgi:hypothetical protein
LSQEPSKKKHQLRVVTTIAFKPGVFNNSTGFSFYITALARRRSRVDKGARREKQRLSMQQPAAARWISRDVLRSVSKPEIGRDAAHHLFGPLDSVRMGLAIPISYHVI